jgi:streptogramin lyase
MAGITSAVGAMGSAFADNPAIKALAQAQARKQEMQGGIATSIGDSGASDLEARVTALESGGAPSSMSPGAIAAGEVMYGSQEARNRSIDPNIFNRR